MEEEEKMTLKDCYMQMGADYEETVQRLRSESLRLNINPAETWSIALYSEFDTLDDVMFYAVHPDHVAAGKLIAEVKESRACVDYEV